MDWDVISAIATVIGTILTFISILIAVSLDQKKHLKSKQEAGARPTTQTITRPIIQLDPAIGYEQRYNLLIPETNTPTAEEPSSGCAPFLYISVGLIGACGGIASILVPWLLLKASPDLQFILYPLVVLGLIGGVFFALVMDVSFKMGKVGSPWLRFPLSAVSGIIGGWLGLLVIIAGFIYMVLTSEGETSLKG